MNKSVELLKLYYPFEVVVDDSGGEFTGWPSICGHKDSDFCLIHRAGFKQEYWGDLSQKQAVQVAETITELINFEIGKSVLANLQDKE